MRILAVVSFRDVTKFAFEFDKIQTSNILADSKFVKFFHVPLSNSNLSQLINFAVVNLTFSEMLKVIVFVGYVNKSKFLNLGFSQHNFHYVKNASMIGINCLLSI